MALTKITGEGLGSLGTGNLTHGSDSGDTRFTLNSANQYTLVLKNAGNIAGQIGGSGSDVLRFSNAAGATIMEMNAGQITKPLQPAFSAGASYTNIPLATTTKVSLVSERFDVGNNLDLTTDTFTAPVTGKYLFTYIFYFSSVDADHATLDATIKTSNTQYQQTVKPDAFLNADANFSLTGSMICDMDASDTFHMNVYVSAGASQTDIHPDSHVSGVLIC